MPSEDVSEAGSSMLHGPSGESRGGGKGGCFLFSVIPICLSGALKSMISNNVINTNTLTSLENNTNNMVFRQFCDVCGLNLVSCWPKKQRSPLEPPQNGRLQSMV
ncbi:hypothetical protein AMECASPLE_027058 [Ameca splendens]|uniref:Uncharacterized protein n=1 Tax=Ameca splendens TaxID=208324 RepID=A0ABV0YGA0_9TELE